MADFKEIETVVVFLSCSTPKKCHLFCLAPKNIDNSQSPDFYRNLQIFGLPTPDFQCFKVERSDNRPLHGFRRHLGCGAVAAKITANVWDIVQLSTSITPQLYIGF